MDINYRRIIYCGTCIKCDPKEDHPKTTIHGCKKLGIRLYHNGHHPNILRAINCPRRYLPKVK